jgi:hypothetical protein
VETKREADTLEHFLYQNGFPATSIHGDRNQWVRFVTFYCHVMCSSFHFKIMHVIYEINCDLLFVKQSLEAFKSFFMELKF